VSDDATEHNSLNVEEFVYAFFLFFLRPRSICWITVENVSLLVNAESATKPSETGNNSNNNNKPPRTAQKPRAPAGQKDASYLVNSIK